MFTHKTEALGHIFFNLFLRKPKLLLYALNVRHLNINFKIMFYSSNDTTTLKSIPNKRAHQFERKKKENIRQELPLFQFSHIYSVEWCYAIVRWWFIYIIQTAWMFGFCLIDASFFFIIEISFCLFVLLLFNCWTKLFVFVKIFVTARTE